MTTVQLADMDAVRRKVKDLLLPDVSREVHRWFGIEVHLLHGTGGFGVYVIFNPTIGARRKKPMRISKKMVATNEATVADPDLTARLIVTAICDRLKDFKESKW